MSRVVSMLLNFASAMRFSSWSFSILAWSVVLCITCWFSIASIEPSFRTYELRTFFASANCADSMSLLRLLISTSADNRTASSRFCRASSVALARLDSSSVLKSVSTLNCPCDLFNSRSSNVTLSRRSSVSSLTASDVRARALLLPPASMVRRGVWDGADEPSLHIFRYISRWSMIALTMCSCLCRASRIAPNSLRTWVISSLSVLPSSIFLWASIRSLVSWRIVASWCVCCSCSSTTSLNDDSWSVITASALMSWRGDCWLMGRLVRPYGTSAFSLDPLLTRSSCARRSCCTCLARSLVC
mmetsp:Transcript_13740/g.18239  ORF Transcript_13740/g.18239 Transcript_13740/m.18239 type:complete len:301 (-) Transcript_13740:47-949(-)